MIIGTNFKLSSKKYLDNRQQCASLNDLIINKDSILYPQGFEVYCIKEKAWYQNVSEGDTPEWKIRQSGTSEGGASIDDTKISATTTWSSEYIYDMKLELQDLITQTEDYVTEIDDRLLYVEGRLISIGSFDGSYDSLTNKPEFPSLQGYATHEYVDEVIANIGKIEGTKDYNELINQPINNVVIEYMIDERLIANVDYLEVGKWYIVNTDLNEEYNSATSFSLVYYLSSDSYSIINTFENEDMHSLIYVSSEDEKEIKIKYTTVNGETYELIYNKETNEKTLNLLSSSGNGGNVNIDLSNYITKEELENKGYITSIPSDYITEEELEDKGYITEHQDLSNYALKSEIPTDYITEIPSEYITETELTAKNYALKSEIPTDYITEEELEDKGYITEHQDLSNYALKSEIPTDYITEIPSEYITETELEDKGYITEIPSEYITETELEEELIFETDILTVNALGGISANTDLNGLTVKEILNKLLFPYIAPVITVTATPNGGTYEKGNTQTITNVKVVVTKKSEKITKIEVLNGTQVIARQNDEAIIDGGTFNYTVNVSVPSTNKQLTVKVTDNSGTETTKKTNSFTFVYPYYWGVCEETDVINADLIKGLTKSVTSKGTKTVTYTTNNQKMIFAYPKSYGTITKILDPNSFDVTSTFTMSQITIIGLDGTGQSYYVYVNSPSTVSDFNMKFSY